VVLLSIRKRPFLPELPGQKRSPPEVRNFV
jgi:hypothetical protein